MLPLLIALGAVVLFYVTFGVAVLAASAFGWIIARFNRGKDPPAMPDHVVNERSGPVVVAVGLLGGLGIYLARSVQSGHLAGASEWVILMAAEMIGVVIFGSMGARWFRKYGAAGFGQDLGMLYGSLCGGPLLALALFRALGVPVDELLRH